MENCGHGSDVASHVSVVIGEDIDRLGRGLELRERRVEAPGELDTAGWLYLRLRRPGYTGQKLGAWIKRARQTNAERAFAFFKHEDAGAGPQLAERFLTLAARPEAKRAPRKQPAASRKHAKR